MRAEDKSGYWAVKTLKINYRVNEDDSGSGTGGTEVTGGGGSDGSGGPSDASYVLPYYSSDQFGDI